MIEQVIFLINYISTLLMTGALWLAQLSQYPLLAFVGKDSFARYEKEHTRRISPVAWTIMTIELITSIALLFIWPPYLLLWQRILGVILILIIWIFTWFVQYPAHKHLSKYGFNTKIHNKLVKTNWVRTISWSTRAIILTLAISQALLR